MSVLAGCSLFNGVMLMSDTRATVVRRGQAPLRVDRVQKLFALNRWSAIGYVGDIQIAGAIVRGILTHVSGDAKRHRTDPLSLSMWLPRFMRYMYAKHSDGITDRRVSFLVASALAGRPNIIERRKAVKLMQRFHLRTLSIGGNWIPEILVRVLQTPVSCTHVAWEGVAQGLLYELSSPHFRPKHANPLEYRVIGSGGIAADEIEYSTDAIFAGQVGNDFFEAAQLCDAVRHAVRKAGIESVGGLFPCVKIDGKGLRPLGWQWEIPAGGTKIELSMKRDGRWVQRNLSSGREMSLAFPWNADYARVRKHDVFDDLDEALEEFKKGDNPWRMSKGVGYADGRNGSGDEGSPLTVHGLL